MKNPSSTQEAGGAARRLLPLLSKALNLLEAAYIALAATGVAFLAGMVFYQVVSRYMLQAPTFPWTEEVARLIFPWSLFAGIAVGFRRGEHIAVDFFFRRLPPKAQKPVEMLLLVVSLFFVLAFVVGAIEIGTRTAGRLTPVLRMSRYWYYLAVPVSAVGMVSFMVEKLIYLALNEPFEPGGIGRLVSSASEE